MAGVGFLPYLPLYFPSLDPVGGISAVIRALVVAGFLLRIA